MNSQIHNSTTHAQPILKAQGISKTYTMGEVKIHALRGVDLELYQGELVVLLGASGSGKSTLLNILGGLDVASSGTLDYYSNDSAEKPSAQNGSVQDLATASARQLTTFRRQHVGFVFQFYNLIASLTALENVAIVTDIATHPMTPEEALELVGLEERMDHFPAQLSGGEQQRVAIARAIAKRPAILMCDEPTGALDSKTGIRVLQVLQDINQELGTTTAVITHNEVIAEMAHRVIRLSDGQVAEVHLNSQRKAPADLHW